MVPKRPQILDYRATALLPVPAAGFGRKLSGARLSGLPAACGTALFAAAACSGFAPVVCTACGLAASRFDGREFESGLAFAATGVFNFSSAVGAPALSFCGVSTIFGPGFFSGSGAGSAAGTTIGATTEVLVKLAATSLLQSRRYPAKAFLSTRPRMPGIRERSEYCQKTHLRPS